MLGLIANNFVRVYHPVKNPATPNDPTTAQRPVGTPTNISIDAAILSLQHSFTVDNYYCGTPARHADGQRHDRAEVPRPGRPRQRRQRRQRLHQELPYDDRLRFRSPPHFLDPVQAAWRVQRYTEQVPAR